MFVLKDYPHHLTNYEGKGTSKIQICKLCTDLRKIWKCSLGSLKISIFRPFYELGKTWKYTYVRLRFQNPNFKSMDGLGKVMSKFKLHC